MSVLALRDVYAGYGGPDVLKGVSLRVESGQCCCVLGANGCGKTTLLRVIAGLLPARGDVLLGGKRLSGMRRREIAGRVGLLSQITQAYFAYTVQDTVMLGRYLHMRGAFGAPTREDRGRVKSCLETVGLWDMRHRTIDTLSGGQLQRVFLARTLAQDPALILLDEPTNHLDLKHQVALTEALRQWSRQEGRAVIGVLHDLNLAVSFADTLVLMREGGVTAQGPPDVALKAELLEDAFGMDVTGYMKRAFSRWA